MYSAAGEIVGRVHGGRWERILETEIFGPLGMASSKTSLAELPEHPDHATGYVTAPGSGGWRAVPPPKSLDALAPAGAIASTARDMARWLLMLASGGRIDGRPFVSAAMFAELTTAKISIDGSLSYALGWATYEWNGLTVVEHNGGSQGLSALVSFVPERRAGFVFLANTSPTAMTKIGNAGKLLYPVILGAAAPAAPPDLPTADALLARMLSAAGGQKALMRHASFELHARKSYENQGVDAALTVRAKAPALHSEEEILDRRGTRDWSDSPLLRRDARRPGDHLRPRRGL